MKFSFIREKSHFDALSLSHFVAMSHSVTQDLPRNMSRFHLGDLAGNCISIPLRKIYFSEFFFFACREKRKSKEIWIEN